MKGFPVGAVLVPVESGSNRLLLDVKVLAEPVDNHLKGFALFRFLGDEVCSFVPGDPFGSFLLRLELGHFLDQLVVETPVVSFAKEFGDNDGVVVFEFSLKDGSGRAHVDAQVGADQGRGRVKRLGVAAGPPRRGLFGNAAARVGPAGIGLHPVPQPVVLGLIHHPVHRQGQPHMVRTHRRLRRTTLPRTRAIVTTTRTTKTRMIMTRIVVVVFWIVMMIVVMAMMGTTTAIIVMVVVTSAAVSVTPIVFQRVILVVIVVRVASSAILLVVSVFVPTTVLAVVTILTATVIVVATVITKIPTTAALATVVTA